jgi:hypothetical protein
VDAAACHHDGLWREDTITDLLASHRHGHQFAAGRKTNQSKSNPKFDRIALLSAPADMMLARPRHQPHPGASGRGRTTAARSGDRGKIVLQIRP